MDACGKFIGSTKGIHNSMGTPDHRIETSVGTFEVDVLAHLIIAILRHHYAILASSPGSFDRRLFFRTSAFLTGKCRFKVKSAGGTCQDGVNMAY